MLLKAFTYGAVLVGIMIQPAVSATFSGDSSQITVSDLPASTLYIRVSGPQRLSIQTEHSYLTADNDTLFPDGQYNYEITASVQGTGRHQVKHNENNGREMDTPTSPQSVSEVVEFGHFRIQNGKVVVVTNVKEVP